jgi:hypothetical protein
MHQSWVSSKLVLFTFVLHIFQVSLRHVFANRQPNRSTWSSSLETTPTSDRQREKEKERERERERERESERWRRRFQFCTPSLSICSSVFLFLHSTSEMWLVADPTGRPGAAFEFISAGNRRQQHQPTTFKSRQPIGLGRMIPVLPLRSRGAINA